MWCYDRFAVSTKKKNSYDGFIVSITKNSFKLHKSDVNKDFFTIHA